MTSWFRMVNNIQIIFLCCKWHLLTCRLKLTDSNNICSRKKIFRCSEPIIWWIHCFYSLPQCTFRSINPLFIEYISNLMHSYFTPWHQLNLMKVLQLNSHTPSAENVLLMVFEVVFLYEFFSVSFLRFMSWRIAAQFACFAVTMFSCSNNVFPPQLNFSRITLHALMDRLESVDMLHWSPLPSPPAKLDPDFVHLWQILLIYLLLSLFLIMFCILFFCKCFSLLSTYYLDFLLNYVINREYFFIIY